MWRKIRTDFCNLPQLPNVDKACVLIWKLVYGGHCGGTVVMVSLHGVRSLVIYLTWERWDLMGPLSLRQFKTLRRENTRTVIPKVSLASSTLRRSKCIVSCENDLFKKQHIPSPNENHFNASHVSTPQHDQTTTCVDIDIKSSSFNGRSEVDAQVRTKPL